MKNGIEKKLTESVLPQIDTLLKARQDAQLAYERVKNLTFDYQRERNQLEADLKELQAQRRQIMATKGDVTKITEEIRTRTDRLAAIQDFLPAGPHADPAAAEKKSLQTAQQQLDSQAQLALNGLVKEEFQPLVDAMVKQLEEVISACDSAILAFQREHRINAPYRASIRIYTNGASALESRITPERYRS